jgi:hypothetical protein
MAILAAPLAVGLYARDKPEKESRVKDKDKPRERKDKASVARKGDDAARLAGTEAGANPRLSTALEAARASRESVRKLPGYTCTFSKQEQLKKGPLMRQVMSLKFRREPFSVYLKYVEPHAGREVIYVEGRNKGKLQVHEPSGLASVIGTISLAPTGNEAMKENRYPVTLIGMEKMLDITITDWDEALKDPDVVVETYPQAKIGDLDCTMFEILHPKAREPFKYQRSRLYIEKKTNLPIRAEQYAYPAKAGEEAPLVEEYTYSDLKIDTPPTDAEFDVNNDSYGYK